MINGEDTRRVRCPFNSSHELRVPKLAFHLAKCPDHKLRKQHNLPIFHCRWHYLHIFLNITDLSRHEEVCTNQPTQVFLEQQKMHS